MNSTPTSEAAAHILEAAGIPAVQMDTDGETVKAGYLLVPDGRRAVNVLTPAPDAHKQAQREAERDGLWQQAHAALQAAGWRLSTNDYGTLRAVAPEEQPTP